MRTALLQFSPEVGDIHGNAARASKQVRAVAAAGAQLIVLPELALTGYPPRDVLLRQGVGQACVRALEQLAAAAPECAVLVGTPRPVDGRDRPLANSVALLRGGRVEAFYDKRLLPNYDVFDEVRYFAPGHGPLVFEHAGARVAVLICEDLWRAQDVDARASYGFDPVEEAAAAKPDVLVVPSASPFQRGKHARHVAILAAAAARVGAPVVSVNQLGGFDDLVFDGDVRAVWPSGRSMAAPRWEDAGCVVELGARGAPEPGGAGGTGGAGERGSSHAGPADHAAADMSDLWRALVCGVRAYLGRTGHQRALLGLSGGIDSALVGALAVAALGPDRVTGVLMPSQWSSPGSITDALELARRTGMHTVTLPIQDAYAGLVERIGAAMKAAGLPGLSAVADENIQSRVRGVQLMALSNSSGALVLTTGNKSEYAVGYATLYGDMNGGLAPIGDVLKTDVWNLARWVNAHHAAAGFAQPPIPQESVDKVPSAELRPNQTDQDTLPPYDQLDAIIRGWVEEELGVEEIAARAGLPLDMVQRWTTAMDRMEYKRAQAALILKVTARAFGPGRRMPLAQRWRPS